MNQESIIRFALTLQNSAPTTINRYICKLAESVIYNSDTNMSAIEIVEAIKTAYDLEFDVYEIKDALKRDKNINYTQENQYQLTAKAIDVLKKQKEPVNLLKQYVSTYKNHSNIDTNTNDIVDLILKYIYHCFNSTADNLMSLINSDMCKPLKDFQSTPNEIELINDFIKWDNVEKNKFLYSTIAFSYDYCAISSRKDSMLSKKMFGGKKFILDTNMIFRMAGINNDERKYIITSFVKKCREVGIKLYYTNEVFDEVYRVINGNIKYIQYITNNDEPIDNSTLQELYKCESNDFYKIYCIWVKQLGNKYNDFQAFQNYLHSLVWDVISDLDLISVEDYSMSSQKETFKSYSDSLCDFKKEKRPNRRTTKESLKTDINNILHTLSLRKTNKENIWQTNEFIVSADQLLTSWAKDTFNGVPIVVIPSVWLSIILRFTGRASNDDYKSYCLFLTLRQHTEENNDFDPTILLGAINQKTRDKDIKEKIIQEIITNKTEYTFDSEVDYDKNTDKAFDNILLELSEQQKEKIITVRNEYKAIIEDNERKQLLIKKEEERTRRAREEMRTAQIAENIVNDKLKKWKAFNLVFDVFIGIYYLIAFIIFIGFFYKISYLYDIALKIIPDDFKNLSLQYFIGFHGIIVGLLCTGIRQLLKKSISPERKKKLKIKIHNKYLKDLTNHQ